ncbi:hypothetical protein GETHLI_20900 [Geothrix limicola]|uniref:Uncharacterized protein n=1 Tax=Geothrix limicola TaxID=2927978 RepID=A0ABQ5QGV7_9BACT|nr:hypothetical protein [Geothrix limicola]GLH73588.1 hypothetical protein GETHLI_20900 [Geothrix limicola]
MTVLLVLFLFLAFVGTDHVVRLAARRAAARAARPKVPARTTVPSYPALTKRAAH